MANSKQKLPKTISLEIVIKKNFEKAEQLRIVTEKIQQSINIHKVFCRQEDLFRTLPIREGPLDQFVQKNYDYPGRHIAHQHMLLPCRKHSFCFRCVFDRYNFGHTMCLGEQESERPWWVEKWYFTPVPRLPLVRKPLPNEDPDETYYNYPHCETWDDEEVMTFGYVQVKSFEEGLHYCALHNLPLDRMEEPEFNDSIIKYDKNRNAKFCTKESENFENVRYGYLKFR